MPKCSAQFFEMDLMAHMIKITKCVNQDFSFYQLSTGLMIQLCFQISVLNVSFSSCLILKYFYLLCHLNHPKL